jgi:hypothetical protein
MKRITKIGGFLLILFQNFQSFSQEYFSYENQVWVGYITSARISDRISIWNDAHFVPESFLILRTGATYHFKYNEKVSGTTTLGFARLWLYSRNEATPTKNEFRPWGQTTASFKLHKFTITNRFRYDARFKQRIENNVLLNEFEFNWRWRYFLMASYPISKNIEKITEWYAYSFNEILFDTGEIITNGFRLNQNRFSVGIGYQIKDLKIQVGYINMIKNPPASGNKIMANTAMLMVFHNFDLRISKK